MERLNQQLPKGMTFLAWVAAKSSALSGDQAASPAAVSPTKWI
jgi:hypothetical protein